MPRAVSTEEQEKPKRAPRKRADSTTPRAPRKRVTKKAVTVDSEGESLQNEVSETKTPIRKAPTPIAAVKAESRATRQQIIVVSLLVIVGIGASAAVGLTDSGAIDVNKTIEERNQRILNNTTDGRDEGTSRDIVVPVQTQTRADGGLRGLGVGAQPPVAPPAATSTATTSDTTASSTDAQIEETASSTDTTVTEETTLEEPTAE